MQGEMSLYRTQKHAVFFQSNQTAKQQLFTLTSQTNYANTMCNPNVEKIDIKKVLTSKVIVQTNAL
jgi:hypothetical protein